MNPENMKRTEMAELDTQEQKKKQKTMLTEDHSDSFSKPSMHFTCKELEVYFTPAPLPLHAYDFG